MSAVGMIIRLTAAPKSSEGVWYSASRATSYKNAALARAGFATAHISNGKGPTKTQPDRKAHGTRARHHCIEPSFGTARYHREGDVVRGCLGHRRCGAAKALLYGDAAGHAPMASR